MVVVLGETEKGKEKEKERRKENEKEKEKKRGRKKGKENARRPEKKNLVCSEVYSVEVKNDDGGVSSFDPRQRQIPTSRQVSRYIFVFFRPSVLSINFHNPTNTESYRQLSSQKFSSNV